jgi:hypothetical protein
MRTHLSHPLPPYDAEGAEEASSALYAANDGAFLKSFILPTHPEVDEVWSRMKDPEAMKGTLN